MVLELNEESLQIRLETRNWICREQFNGSQWQPVCAASNFFEFSISPLHMLLS